jgi:hypothetical protein
MKLRDLWKFFTLEIFVENIFWCNHFAALFLVLKVIYSKKQNLHLISQCQLTFFAPKMAEKVVDWAEQGKFLMKNLEEK